MRPLREEDLMPLWELSRKEESPEWKLWDAPYYEHKSMDYETFIGDKNSYIDQDDIWAIEADGQLIGTVSYYWEHKPSLWLEMGIVIFQPKYWSGGIGTEALRQWISHLFRTMPLERVGFTTWSGNVRMMRAGTKLGMTLEARLRKVRYWKGEYYDSIRMGLLREEWERNPLYEAAVVNE
ncbi:GNAT family N-acetyltransferase [Paenibacillus herberti]|uniref:GNAT family N-acetyltransferase n=1 Tax=Paenibacillus herberti TaxID=1619309 RepID=UPI002481C48D|nr:GNAT family protein [Paenibacillus herberti]